MPPRLYTMCLEVLIPLIEKIGEDFDWEHGTGPMDNLGKNNSWNSVTK
jgi:hypothetical protein